jgi:hypothetical protein
MAVPFAVLQRLGSLEHLTRLELRGTYRGQARLVRQCTFTPPVPSGFLLFLFGLQ